MEHGKLTGAYVDPGAGKVTVAAYWSTWSARQPWRQSSREVASSYFRNHVEPGLGGRPLNTLRRGDIEAWGSGLAVADRTARQIIQYVSTMLDAAVADGLIASNPARGASRPRVESQPILPFTSTDVDALRGAAPDWFRVALDLGLGAGLRQSEATGLTSTAWTSYGGRSSWIGSSCRLSWGSQPLALPSPTGPIERFRWRMPSSRAWPCTSSASGRDSTESSSTPPTARPCAARGSASGGGRRESVPVFPALGSTTRGTRSPRCSCQAASP
jgi:hypothetical protein